MKDCFLILAHLFGTICLKHSTILILPPLLKPPSRRTCLIIILNCFSQPCLSPCPMCECVSVVSVIVKHPVLPPCVVDGRCRNPLYYYCYYWILPNQRTCLSNENTIKLYTREYNNLKLCTREHRQKHWLYSLLSQCFSFQYIYCHFVACVSRLAELNLISVQYAMLCFYVRGS